LGESREDGMDLIGRSVSLLIHGPINCVSSDELAHAKKIIDSDDEVVMCDVKVEALVQLGRGVAGGSAGRALKTLICELPKSNSKKNKMVVKVFRWLAYGWPEALVEALRDSVFAVDATDTKTLLQAVRVVRGAFGEGRTALDDEISAFQVACAWHLSKDLCDTATRYSAKSGDSRFLKPTKLAVEAGDLLVQVLFRAGQVAQTNWLKCGMTTLEENNALCAIWKNRYRIKDYVDVLKEWNQGSGRELYLVGLQDLENSLSLLLNHEPGLSCALAIVANLISASLGLLIEDDFSKSSQIAVKELKMSLAELERNTTTKEADSWQTDEIARLQARRVLLLLGKLSRKRAGKVLDEIGQLVIQVACKQLDRKHGTAPMLCSRLFSFALQYQLVGTNEGRASIAYAPLLQMLKEGKKDEVSACVIDIVARGVIQHVEELLPELLGMLASSSVCEQTNVLQVLEEFNKLVHADMLKDSLCVLMAERVIELVEHDNHTIRRLAVRVLSLFPPAFIVDLLCSFIERADTERLAADIRSTAIAALVGVFENHTKTLQVVASFLSCIDRTESESTLVADTSAKWRDVIPLHMYKPVLECVIRAMFDSPESTQMVSVARNVAAINGGVVVPGIVMDKMKTQPELSEEFIEQRTQEETKVLLFERLSPLLYLRMLNLCQLTLDNDTEEELGTLLVRRMIALYEFKQVRQLSAQIFARLSLDRIVWPTNIYFLSMYTSQTGSQTSLVSKTLEMFAELGNEAIFPPDITVVKCAILCACEVVSTHPTSVVPEEFLCCFLSIIAMSGSCSVDSQMGNLQQGCLEFLRLFLTVNTKAWGDQVEQDNKKIQECTDVAEDDEIHGLGTAPGPHVLEWVLSIVETHPSLATRICCTNSIVLAVRSMAELAGVIGKQGDSRSPEMRTGVQGLVSQSLVDRVSRFIQTKDFVNYQGFKDLLPSLLQLLFTCVLVRNKVHETGQPLTTASASRLCSIVLAGLSESEDTIRLGSLKLLGTLLSLPPIVSLPDGMMGRFVDLLRGVANIDKNQTARQLASELLKSLTS